MRTLATALAALAAAAPGCGAEAARPGPPEVGAAAPAVRSLLVLYRDAAQLRSRRRVTLEGGAAQLTPLPPGERLAVRPLDGGAPLELTRTIPATGALDHLAGDRVVASAGGREIAGTIESWEGGVLVLRAGGSLVRLRHPERVELAASESPGAATLRAADGGSATRALEISSWLDGLRWAVGYTAVIEAGAVRLQGWLSVESRAPFAIDAGDVVLVSRRLKAGPKGAARGVRLGIGLALPPGGTAQRALFAGPRRVPARVTRVFDPIGEALDSQGTHPVTRRSYGTGSDRRAYPVAMAVDLDLEAAGLGPLPRGRIQVFRRAGGELRAVSSTHGFGEREPAPVDRLAERSFRGARRAPAQRPSGARIYVGVAPKITGRRWQADYALDPDNHRLVEEIRVELSNRSGADAAIEVREHLVRGVSWTVAYHNQVGRIAKDGPQAIRFDVEVPAGASRRIAYRVVYHW